MDFNKVNYDGDLEDRDQDDLIDLVEDFEKAQEANVAEFETAQEQLQDALDDDDASFEDVFGEVKDFASAKADLIGEVTEFDSFAESPLTEADLEDATFSKVREHYAYFADLDAEADARGGGGDEGGEDGEFSDMGQRAPTNDDVDDDEEFARRHLGGMPGFN